MVWGIMKRFFIYLWEAPQRLLALAVRAAVKKEIVRTETVAVPRDGSATVYRIPGFTGLSLGGSIFVSDKCSADTLRHEIGHSVQSRMLGWFYLLVIGLPSLIGNIYNRAKKKGSKWYYSQPWEAWADRLGGVQRGF